MTNTSAPENPSPRGEAKTPTDPQIDRAIITRIDRWFGGGLCIAFKHADSGLPNTPMTYLYRSTLLEGLGVKEAD